MSKIFVATYVDYTEGCNGKPEVLGVYDSRIEAEKDVSNDMTNWEKNMNENVNYVRMSAEHCEWNISEIEKEFNKVK